MTPGWFNNKKVLRFAFSAIVAFGDHQVREKRWFKLFCEFKVRPKDSHAIQTLQRFMGTVDYVESEIFYVRLIHRYYLILKCCFPNISFMILYFYMMMEVTFRFFNSFVLIRATFHNQLLLLGPSSYCLTFGWSG